MEDPQTNDATSQVASPASQTRQVENLQREAREAERSEQYPLAIELLEWALRIQPTHYGCRLQLASISNQLGKLSRAMGVYCELLPVAPRDSILLNNIGSVCFDLGLIDKAFQFFHNSIECDPSNDLPHSNLAYLYSMMGEKEKAMLHADELRRLIPHSRYQPFARVAEVRALLVNGRKSEALDLLVHATIEDKQNLLFNLQRLLLAKDLGIESHIHDLVALNIRLAKEDIHKGYAPHKTYYRVTLFHLIAGQRSAAMQSAKSAILEGPYKGVIRFAGLYYLDQLGLPPNDKIRQLWQREYDSLPPLPEQTIASLTPSKGC